MSKATQKIKKQPTEPTFWQAVEPIDKPAKKIFTEHEITTEDTLVNKTVLLNENSSDGTPHILYKIDFNTNSKEKFDLQSLPKPKGWDIADGDYVKDTAYKEVPRFPAFKEIKNYGLVLLIAALAFAILLVLLFSSFIETA